jgi:hypothetical protein
LAPEAGEACNETEDMVDEQAEAVMRLRIRSMTKAEAVMRLRIRSMNKLRLS